MILNLNNINTVYFNGTKITRINFNGTNVWTGGGSPSVPKIQYGTFPGLSTSVKSAIANQALSLLGTPFIWGGTTPSGFDNNGFVYYLYQSIAGVSLPRQNSALLNQCSLVSAGTQYPGDIFFQFNSSGTLSSIGIYTGTNSGVWCISSSGVAPVDLTLYM